MPYKLFIFPAVENSMNVLKHDTAGWERIGVPDTHWSGREGQSFDIPDNTPNMNGVELTRSAPGYFTDRQRGILLLNDGGIPWPFDPRQQAAYSGDDFAMQPISSAPAFGPVQVAGNHFTSGGKRWVWRMTTGFLDYKIFLDGGDLRTLLKQNQDLGARGRRVFLNIVNIVNFDPDAYGPAFYGRLPEYLALNAEYEQYVELDVLTDSGYRGWSLAKSRDHWARSNDAVRGQFNAFTSLTNEYDHGGNLVGSPNDYARPSGIITSQGSAVSDAPPPQPGWDFREFHVTKPFPKIYLFEDMIYNGLGVDVNGKRFANEAPIVLTEGPRFDEGNPYTDERLARTHAYESLALGSGLTLHTDDGKWGRLLQPRQASCVRTAMKILDTAL